MKYGLLSKHLFEKTQSNDKPSSEIASARYHMEEKAFIKTSCGNNAYTLEKRFLADATFEGLRVVSFQTEYRNL